MDGVLPQVKSEGTADGGDSSELQQALNEREEQIKASDEKIKDLQVGMVEWTLYTLEPLLISTNPLRRLSDVTVDLAHLHGKLADRFTTSHTHTHTQDKYLRALAEAENTRTRLTRQVEDAKKYGIQDFSKDVVEVADILDTAVGSVKTEDLKDNKPLANLLEGLKITEAELHKVMKKNGLQKIDQDGVTFDPNIHEALFEVPGKKAGMVAVVSRVGYILHGRTIRPARVGVVKATDS